MKGIIKTILPYLYFILAILTTLPLFINVRVKEEQYSANEKYDESLGRITTIGEAVKYIQSISGNKIDFDTIAYVKNASNFTKDRFYHGLARYTVSDNWIAYFGNKYLWSHLSAVVRPDDILKHSGALCSQQTIVFLEILKAKGIKTRSVGLGYAEGPGHFLCEVWYEDNWHLYDVTMEPEWEKLRNKNESFDFYKNGNDTLLKAYEGRIEKTKFLKLMEKVEYGELNKFPAENMQLFHQLSKLATYVLPAIFLILASFSFIRRHKRAK